MASERDWKKPVKVLKGFKKVGIDVKTPQDEVDMEGETSSSSSSSTFVNYCAMDGTVISKVSLAVVAENKCYLTI